MLVEKGGISMRFVLMAVTTCLSIKDKTEKNMEANTGVSFDITELKRDRNPLCRFQSDSSQSSSLKEIISSTGKLIPTGRGIFCNMLTFKCISYLDSAPFRF